MTWTLITEIGGGELTRTDAATGGRLSFPTYAAPTGDGGYVIAEEIGVHKQVPFRFECRTIRVSAAGSIDFDTMCHGIDDGFGCPLDDGRMAILRRTKWELLLTTPRGEITSRLDLARFSKRLPRYVTWTHRRTFLAAFFNRSFEVDIVEFDEQARLLWYLPRPAARLGILGSAQLLPDDSILIADPFRHLAVEVDRRGQIVWQFGEADNPSAYRLSGASAATACDDGRRAVADTRNHRILLVDRDGAAEPLKLDDAPLSDPVFVNRGNDGNLLICDTGNARVLEVDAQGRTVWRFGGEGVGQRVLSYPRSIEVTGPDRYLTADTAHDRVVEIAGGRLTEKPFQGEPPLFWPRCVRALAGGSLLIADARNGRIVEVAADGRVLNQLAAYGAEGGGDFHDPHDVRLLKNGRLLVTDSTRNVVVEVDWDGRVHAVIGQAGDVDLDDPHSAQQLDDGSVLIADTGNHRIVRVDAGGRTVDELYDVRDDNGCYRFCNPRYVESLADGTMAIADTGNNRILAATLAGDFIWEVSQVPNSRRAALNQPRWVKLISRREVVICDHFNHRILHMARAADPNAEG